MVHRISKSTSVSHRSHGFRPTSFGAFPIRFIRRSCFFALTASLCCIRNAFLSYIIGFGDGDDNDDDAEVSSESLSFPPPSSWCCLAVDFRLELQLLLHTVTSSQLRSHFFLQTKGRSHTKQTLEGRFCFATVFPFLFFIARTVDDEIERQREVENRCRLCCRRGLLSASELVVVRVAATSGANPDNENLVETAATAGRKARLVLYATARWVAMATKIRGGGMVTVARL